MSTKAPPGVREDHTFPYVTVKRLHAGVNHSFAILRNQSSFELYGWGTNTNNIIGLGPDISCAHNPEAIASIRDKRIVDIDSGRFHTVFIASSADNVSGKAYSWGLGNMGRLGYTLHPEEPKPENPQDEPSWYAEKPYKITVPSEPRAKFVRVVCASNFSFLLSNRGGLYVFGASTHGALGLGGIQLAWEPQQVPIYIRDGSEMVEEYIIDVAAKGNHVLAVTKTGRVYAWGCNNDGQLGLGDTKSRTVPTLVTALQNEIVSTVNVGSTHSAAITVSGLLYTWGNGSGGKLGHNEELNLAIPEMVQSLSSHVLTTVKCGTTSTFAISTENQVFYSGWGPTVMSEIAVRQPRKLNVKYVVQLSVGPSHVLAGTIDGDVYVWGLADSGKLGLTGDTDIYVPVTVSSLRQRLHINDLVLKQIALTGGPMRAQSIGIQSGTDMIKKLSCGENHILVLTKNGEVYGAGSNENFQLGFDTNIAQYPDFVKIYFPDDTPATDIAAGGRHSLVVFSNGTLFAAGDNGSGQCGFGQLEKLKVFTRNKSLACVIQASAGPDYSAVIASTRATSQDLTHTSSGELFVAGDSSDAKILFSMNANQFRRIHVLGKDVSQVSCGQSHMLALVSDGTVLSWGNGSHGKLGYGDIHNQAEPSVVNFKLPANKKICAIAAGTDHSLALTNLGDAYGWGKGLFFGAMDDVMLPLCINLNLVSQSDRKPGVVQIAAGVDHSAFITRSGKLHLFGCNDSYQLGSSVERSKSKSLVSNSIEFDCAARLVSLGRKFTVVILNNGEYLAWGLATSGSLAIGPISTSHVRYPTNGAIPWENTQTEARAQSAAAPNLPEEDIQSSKHGQGSHRDLYTYIAGKLNPNIRYLQKALQASPTHSELENDYHDCAEIYGIIIEDLMSTCLDYRNISTAQVEYMSSLHQIAAILSGKTTARLPSHFSYHSDPDLMAAQELANVFYLQPSYFVRMIQHGASEALKSDIIDLIFSLFTSKHEEPVLFSILRCVAAVEINELPLEYVGTCYLPADSCFILILQEYVRSKPIVLRRLVKPLITYSGMSDNTLIDLLCSTSIGTVETGYLWFADTIEEYQQLLVTNKSCVMAEIQSAAAEKFEAIVTSTERIRGIFANVCEALRVVITQLVTDVNKFFSLDPPLYGLMNEFATIILKRTVASEERIDALHSQFIKSYLVHIIYPILQAYPESTTYIGMPSVDSERISHNVHYIGERLYWYLTDRYDQLSEDMVGFFYNSFECLHEQFAQNAKYYENYNDVSIVEKLITSHIDAVHSSSITRVINHQSFRRICNFYYETATTVSKLGTNDPAYNILKRVCSATNRNKPFMIYNRLHQDSSNETTKLYYELPISITPLLFLDCKSIVYDHITMLPVPQSFVAKSIDLTTNAALVLDTYKATTGQKLYHSSVVRPYSQTKHPYLHLLDALQGLSNIDASDTVSFHEALTASAELLSRRGATPELEEAVSKAITLLETEEASLTIYEIIAFGARVLENRILLKQYYQSLFKTSGKLKQLVRNLQDDLKSFTQSLSETTTNMIKGQLDSTRSSIVTAYDLKPYFWKALPNLGKDIPMLSFSYPLDVLTDMKILHEYTGPAYNIVHFKRKNTSITDNQWDITLEGQTVTIVIYPFKSINYYERLDLFDGTIKINLFAINQFLGNITAKLISNHAMSHLT